MNHEPTTRRSGYLSYLLRLWRVSDEGSPAWRGSLQRPGSAAVTGFADLEQLLQFLRDEAAGQGTGDAPSAR